VRLMAEPYYHPSHLEVLTGWVSGVGAPPEVETRQEAPLAALAEVIAPALESSPCYVSFSGGRDSSAVLAVTTAVARKRGYPDPIPVTQLYPDVPEGDETEWQQAVIQHLGLTDWVRLVVHGQADLLGQPAQESLRSRGLLWPPAVHNKVVLLESLSPGSLLTGEGGDEIFGRRRVAAWAHLRQGPPVHRRAAVQAAAGSLMPRLVRRRRAVAMYRAAAFQPWLRPAVMEESIRLAADDEVSEPLRWDRALLWVCSRRAAIVTARNYSALASEYGMRISNPLLEPRFLAALGRSVGGWGFPGRTAAMRALFGHLLPATVVERRTKALFNRVFLGEATAEFARHWDGSGVDGDLVDAERLRQEWLSETPSSLSASLLHSVWLRTESAKVSVI
jgi:hypothetical protein